MTLGKVTTTAGLSVLMGTGVTRSGTARGTVQFHPRSESAKQLRAQFKSRRPDGARFAPGQPPTGESSLLVPGRAGLFQLGAFKACRSPSQALPPSTSPKTPPPPSGVDLAKAALARHGLKDHDGLARKLAQVHDKLASAASKATPPPAYTFDSLMTTLLSQASISELSESGDTTERDKAAAGLGALVESVLEAMGPGRDGFALNRLLGQRSALDGAVTALRVECMEAFLRDVEGTLDDKYTQNPAHRAQAQALVAHDLALSTARNQLHNALAQAGVVRTLGGLGGLKVDSALVASLRKTLGGDAARVGLVIAHMLFLEQAATASEPARQMLASVDKALAQTRSRRLEAAGQRAVDRASSASASRPKPSRDEIPELAARERYLLSRRNALLPENLLAAADLIQGLTGEPAHALASPDAAELAQQLRPQFKAQLPQAGQGPTLEALLSRERATLRRLERELTGSHAARSAQEAVTRHLRTSLDVAARSAPLEGADDCRRFRQAIDLANQPSLAKDPKAQEDLATLCRALRGFDPASLRITDRSAREPTPSSLRALSHDDGLMAAVDSVIALSDRVPSLQSGIAESTRRIVQLEDRQQQQLRDATRAAILLHATPAKGAGFAQPDASAVGATLATWGVTVDAHVRRLIDANLAKPLTAESVRAWRQSSGRDDVPEPMKSVRPSSSDGSGRDDASEPTPFGDPLSSAELKVLRLKTTEAEEVAREVRKLTQTGLASAFDAAKVRTTMDAIVHRLVCDDKLSGLPDLLQGRRDEDKALVLRSQLVQKLLDASVQLESRDSGASALTQDESLRAAFSSTGHPLARLQVESVQAQLRETASGYTRLLDQLDKASEALSRAPTDSAAQRQATTDVAKAIDALDAVLKERATVMQPATSAALRQAVRAAILMPLDEKRLLHTFRPAEHRVGICKTLATWGVPVELVAPEIDALLAESFGPDELDLWREQAGIARDAPVPVPPKGADAPERLRTGVPAEVRDRLVDSILKVPVPARARVRVTSGTRVEVQTGRVPIDLAGIFGINTRGSASFLDAMELSYSLDGLELQLRTGQEWKFGVQASAQGTGIVPASFLVAEASASVEGGLSTVKEGLSIRVPNDAAGREAMAGILHALVSKEVPDLSKATTVALLSETKAGLKAGVQGRVGVNAPIRKMPGSTAHATSRHLGMSAGARVGLSAGLQGTRQRVENSKFSLQKTEREVALELSASLGASTTIGVPVAPAHDGIHKVSSDLAEASASLTFSVKRQTRTARNEMGEFDNQTEQYASVFLPPVGREAVISRVGGEPLARLMAALERSTSKDEQATLAAVKALMASTGTSETLTLTLRMDREKLDTVNAIAREVQNLKIGTSGRGSTREALERVAALEEKIQQIVDDERNYDITCFDVVPISETTQSTSVNAHFVKVSKFVETKGTHVASRILVSAELSRRPLPAKPPAKVFAPGTRLRFKQ
jgi:hypothetical protein